MHMATPLAEAAEQLLELVQRGLGCNGGQGAASPSDLVRHRSASALLLLVQDSSQCAANSVPTTHCDVCI